jgi:hypothetical protein
MAIKVCNNTVIDNDRRFLEAANRNILFGTNTGCCLTTGQDNIFLGDASGRSNSTGGQNIFLGCISGLYNTSGSSNFFGGTRAGRFNTTGDENVFLGADAGFSNSTGSWNVFLGVRAGSCNTGLYSWLNTYVGHEAGCRNNGCCNVAIGARAGLGIYSGLLPTPDVGSGRNNVSVGFEAGYSSYGCFNVFLGFKSGHAGSSTLGCTANCNVFLGYYSGKCNVQGVNNLYAGAHSGLLNCGNANAFLGFRAGECATGASGNTLVGTRSGFSVTTGANNILIGQNAGTTAFSPTTGLVNMTTQSNHIVIGNTAITNFYTKMGTSSGCASVKWNTTTCELFADTSSIRFKTNVRPFLSGVCDVKKLETVRFNLLQEPEGSDHVGFIAEDVDQTGLKEFVFYDENEQPLGLDYDKMIVLAVNAIKELSNEVDVLKQQVQALSRP